MDPYAVEADLAEWLTGSDYPAPTGDAATRVLTRASEVIRDHVTGWYDTDDTGTPTDAAVTAALTDATCAQVEQWAEVGEELDVAGYPQETGVSAGSLSINRLPAALAPRAARLLRQAGLYGPISARLV